MENFLKKIIVEAGEIALTFYDRGNVTVATKSYERDFVTEADIAVNDFLVGAIRKEYPDHQITSEELKEPVNKGAAYEWVIDPIDGTSNFVDRIPLWGIIIALIHDGKQRLGGFYVPYCRDLYFAKKGEGAFLNGQPIHVSDTEDFDRTTGILYRSGGRSAVYGQYGERYRDALARFMKEMKGSFRHYGSMINLMYFAKGSYDFYINNSGLDHDYLAPLLIAKEAGAKVTDSDGNPWQRGRQDVVAANPNLHGKVLELFRPHR